MRDFVLRSCCPLLCSLLGAGAFSAAKGDTVTNVAITYNTGLYSNWSGAINGSTIAAAPTNGNQSTGITFAYWSGSFNQINPGQTTVFSIPSVALGATSRVNTLFNNFYGDADVDAVVTFMNSNNQTAVYDLVGGDTIRDYNENTYQNNLTGGTPGVVTAEEWFSNGIGQHLDVQSFDLPTSWDGSSLVSMSVLDSSPTGADDVLSAVQVGVAGSSTGPGPGVTPEPSSLLLLGTGLTGMVGVMRRRFAREI